MKNKMIILLATAMLALGASNAMAYFDNGDLIRFVYNSATGNETGTDLGSYTTLISEVTASGSVNIGSSAGLFTNGAGLTSSSDSTLKVAYVVANDEGLGNSYWLSGPQGTASSTVAVAGPASYNGLQNNMSNLFDGGIYYGGQTASQLSATGGTANVNSYQKQLGNGYFAGFYSMPVGETSLATLATASVSQGLYFWNDVTAGGNGSAVVVNGQALEVLTNADGSTTLVGGSAVSATPIPAAAYLLGSGLMGLLGLRRKKRA